MAIASGRHSSAGSHYNMVPDGNHFAIVCLCLENLILRLRIEDTIAQGILYSYGLGVDTLERKAAEQFALYFRRRQVIHAKSVIRTKVMQGVLSTDAAHPIIHAAVPIFTESIMTAIDLKQPEAQKCREHLMYRRFAPYNNPSLPCIDRRAWQMCCTIAEIVRVDFNVRDAELGNLL